MADIGLLLSVTRKFFPIIFQELYSICELFEILLDCILF